MAKPAKRRSGNLRDDCVVEALAIIEEHGLDQLSLREVARRLGVSHGAPYKHYPSRNHLLAEVVRRAFDEFAAHLDALPQTDDPDRDMAAMGEAYVGYAMSRALQYRLMFATSLPDPTAHPDMLVSARHAFDMLRAALSRRRGGTPDPKKTDLDALFVWSLLHGFASILRSDVTSELKLASGSQEDAMAHMLERIGSALGAPGEAG